MGPARSLSRNCDLTGVPAPSGNVPGTVRAYGVAYAAGAADERAGAGDDGRHSTLTRGISGDGGTGNPWRAACRRFGAALRPDAPELAGERRWEHRCGRALRGRGLRRHPPSAAQPDRLDLARRSYRQPAASGGRRVICAAGLPFRPPPTAWCGRAAAGVFLGCRRPAAAADDPALPGRQPPVAALAPGAMVLPRCGCVPSGVHVRGRGHRPDCAPCPRRLGRGAHGRRCPDGQFCVARHRRPADIPRTRRILGVVRRRAGAELATLLRRPAPAAEMANERGRRPRRLPGHLPANTELLPEPAG